MPINEKYEALSAEELAALIRALRQLDTDGLKHTEREQSYIFRHISPPKLIEVLSILNKRGGLAAVLSGEAPSKVEGR